MGSFNRIDSQRWWREGEYIPKNSKWLLESLQGVHGTVESIVNLIEGEDETDTPDARAETRDSLVGKVKEMCKAYFELVEQHDRLVGANYTHTKNSTKLSNQHIPVSPTINEETETKDGMDVLKEKEIEGALTEYNILAKRLQNVESKLSVTKNELAKKEEMLFTSEKLNYQQKANLESLRQKVELQEKELKQKREEIERIKPRLSEMETCKSNLDTKMSLLEEEIKILNNQKVSYEERINKLLKDLSLLNETKENLEKEVAIRIRDKDNLQRELSSQILKAGMVRSKHKEEIMKYKIDNEILSEKNSVLESTLSKANIEFEALKERVLALDAVVEILALTISGYLKKNKSMKVSLSNLKTKPEFSIEKSNGEVISQNLIFDKKAVFTQVQLLEDQIKKLNETVKEAECTKLESENNIAALNIDIARFNVQKPVSVVAAYDLLIRMRIWREVDVFLNKMPVYRKFRDHMETGIDSLKEGLGTMKCRTSGLSSWLTFFVAQFFRFFGPVKYHLVKCSCSIRTVLYFYWSLFTARFPSDNNTSEIDSSISKSKNDPVKIRDCTNVELKEVGRLEMDNQEELLSKREAIQKITELQQEELKEQVEQQTMSSL